MSEALRQQLKEIVEQSILIPNPKKQEEQDLSLIDKSLDKIINEAVEKQINNVFSEGK